MQRAHMEKVVAWAEEMEKNHPEFSAKFNSNGFLTLPV